MYIIIYFNYIFKYILQYILIIFFLSLRKKISENKIAKNFQRGCKICEYSDIELSDQKRWIFSWTYARSVIQPAKLFAEMARNSAIQTNERLLNV